MWGPFRRKEPDISALQKVFGRFTSSTSDRREEVVYGNAMWLGFVVLLILLIGSFSVWLLRRSSREETAPAVPMEADEEAALLEDEVVVPPGAPSAEDAVAPGEDIQPLEEEIRDV